MLFLLMQHGVLSTSRSWIFWRKDINNFLVGFWVDKYPERVKEIAKRGHEVANHSTTHPNMSKLSREQIINEIMTTQEKIEKLAGDRSVRLLRPPFGDYNDLLIQTCRELGFHVIQWDVDSLDWKEMGVQHMFDRVTQRVDDGSIVLFHNNAKYITEALPLILDHLLAEGYDIVPVSELIYKKSYRLIIQDVNTRQRTKIRS